MNRIHLKVIALSMLIPMFAANDATAFERLGHARTVGHGIAALYCDPPRDQTCYKSDGPDKPKRGELVHVQFDKLEGGTYWRTYQVMSDTDNGNPEEGQPEFEVQAVED